MPTNVSLTDWNFRFAADICSKQGWIYSLYSTEFNRYSDVTRTELLYAHPRKIKKNLATNTYKKGAILKRNTLLSEGATSIIQEEGIYYVFSIYWKYAHADIRREIVQEEAYSGLSIKCHSEQ